MTSDHQSDGVLPLAVSPESRGCGFVSGFGAVDEASETDGLLRITALADEFKNDQIRDDARSAAERIAEGRFYVACVGHTRQS
jgi:hypothetical protein